MARLANATALPIFAAHVWKSYRKNQSGRSHGQFRRTSCGGRRPRRFVASFNGSPGQDYPIIVREPDVAGAVFLRARWGLIPRWMKDPNGRPRPINARSEVVATNGMFKYLYRYGRALMPIDNYFEWQAMRGENSLTPLP